jgi:hypothetical protein
MCKRVMQLRFINVAWSIEASHRIHLESQRRKRKREWLREGKHCALKMVLEEWREFP